jgi:hypothetical protein
MGPIESFGRRQGAYREALTFRIAVADHDPVFYILRELELIEMVGGLPFPNNFSRRIDLDQAVVFQ